MARFYARFDHGVESGLEALTTGNYYQRKVITSATASSLGFADLQTGLITSRSALSNAMYAQIDVGNRDGNQGPIIPPSNTAGNVLNIVRSGGNLSWNNIYKTTTIPGVPHPADPRVRPTASIYTDDGNLTAVSPTDGGTINDNLYQSASNAVSSVVSSIKDTFGSPPYTTDGSPYARLGVNPSRTLHSIWHDYSLNYFAWDDFTPGTPQTLTGNVDRLGNWSTGSTNYTNAILLESSDELPITASWTGEYRADLAGTSSLTASLWRQSGNIEAFNVITGSTATPTVTGTYKWDGIAGLGGNVGGYSYKLTATMSFADAIIPTHTSSRYQVSIDDIVHVILVYPVSLRYATGLGGLCGTNGTTATFYLDNVAPDAGIHIFSQKYPIAFPTSENTYYVASAVNVINGTTIYSHEGDGVLKANAAEC